MDTSEFGPFATIVATALALVAVFSALLLRMLGRLSRWTWLIDEPPPFLIKAGARILAVALMATSYVVIDRSNYGWFAAGAIASGLLGFIYVRRFDSLRRLHVESIPLVGSAGEQLRDTDGRPRTRNVIIGKEENMLGQAAEDLQEARKKGGLSLPAFMSGYGSINNPEDLWAKSVLVDTATRLSGALIYIVLFAVITLFLSALVIEVAA